MSIEKHCKHEVSQSLLAGLLARIGRYDDAIAQTQKCFSFPGAELRARTPLGMVYAITCRDEEARKIAGEHFWGSVQTAKKPSKSADFE